jgi:predicted ATPase
VRLFHDRARAVRPDFTLDHENARAVASLCAELEGVPSAVEAPAARVPALTPAQLAERSPMRAGPAIGVPMPKARSRPTLGDRWQGCRRRG